MTPVSDPRRPALAILAVLAIIAAASAPAAAQSLRELNQRLDEIAPQVSEGMTNPQAASAAIDRLDQAESDFAQIAENGRVGQADLLATYSRLESMLSRMYSAYQRRKDDCINTIDNGGSCDYEQPEQLALRALYPLSWLRFEGAGLYSGQPAMARRLLNQSIDGFTDSTLVIFSPELVRENLLGRGYAERDLGKFERSEYARAIADFKRIMKDGSGTRQYRPAEQGLATTYAAMGRLNEAQGLTSKLAENATGQDKGGLEMLHLRELFRAEAAEGDSGKRAALHRQIIGFVRARQDDKNAWAIAVAAAAQYVSDPVAEFGQSGDPFENWLLANVLYYKHRALDAAKYYWAAARGGKYPKAYKYAADLYYTQGRLGMVEKIAGEIAAQPGNPDAQWASYMLFKIPRVEWERGGMRDAALENAWAAGARNYLKRFPHGQYAFEPRFRLAEMLERKGDYAAAAQQYQLVSGNPDYDFTARFDAAESWYKALDQSKNGKLPGANPAALRASAINALRDAINMEPGAERDAPPPQRKALHDSRGRAIYMLAALLEHQPQINYREVASILNGYEAQYPAEAAHANEIYEWRAQALDHTGQYPELERQAEALVAHDAPPAQTDYIKEIGLDFWNNGKAKRAAGDNAGYAEDARLTALTYEYFERMVREGKIPAKNLTGTLSMLGRAYLAMNDTDKARSVFEQVAKADPGSPDANAGLARIAQLRNNYTDALDLWSRVEAVAAESDPLFYEAKYNMAEIFATEGNINGACNELAATRNAHPSLGSPGMKAQWGALEHRICFNRTES
jgi:outer membrane protein assembly factor BamD (BamD/ComL family)